MVIRTISATPSSDPIPPYIYSIHQSLIQQNIITHPEIITCSQQWINKLEKDIPNPSKSNRMKRCHYVNHCPICNHLRKKKSFLRWIHIVNSSWTMMEEISYWHSLSDITNLIHLSSFRKSWMNQLDCSEPPEPSPKNCSPQNIGYTLWRNMKSVGVNRMDIRHIAIYKSAQQIQFTLMKYNPH